MIQEFKPSGVLGEKNSCLPTANELDLRAANGLLGLGSALVLQKLIKIIKFYPIDLTFSGTE